MGIHVFFVTYSLTASAASGGSAYIGGTGTATSATLAAGTAYTLRGVPTDANRYGSATWSVDGSTLTGLSVTWTPSSVTGNVSAVCTFVQTRWQLTAGNIGNGTCAVGSSWLEPNGTATVTATPAAHSKFSSFSVSGCTVSEATTDANGVATATVTMGGSADATVTANFEVVDWHLAILTVDKDAASVDSTSVAEYIKVGTESTLDVYVPNATATTVVYVKPKDGKKVKKWLLNGTESPNALQYDSGTGVYSFTIQKRSADLILQAMVIDRCYLLTVEKVDSSGGSNTNLVSMTVTNGSVTVTGQDSYTSSVESGTAITVKANAEFGGAFDGFTVTTGSVTDTDTSASGMAFAMPEEAVTVKVACHIRPTVTLTFGAVNAGNDNDAHGTVGLRQYNQTSPMASTTLSSSSAACTVYKGEKYYLTATDDDGKYFFNGWVDGNGNSLSDTNLSHAFTLGESDGDTTIRAQYALRSNGKITVKFFQRESGGGFTALEESEAYGLTITTPNDDTDLSGEKVWLCGASRKIEYTCRGSILTETLNAVTTVYRWTPYKVEAKDDLTEATLTKQLGGKSIYGSGFFYMTGNMTVSMYLDKVAEASMDSVTMTHMTGSNLSMGDFSVYPSDSYYSEGTSGGVKTVSQLVEGGKSCTVAACPMPGHRFVGWYKASPCTVTLDANGGTDGTGTDSVTANYGLAMPTVATPPTKPDSDGKSYSFAGYYEDKNGAGTQYYNSLLVGTHWWDKIGTTATLYAKWNASTIGGTPQSSSPESSSSSVSPSDAAQAVKDFTLVSASPIYTFKVEESAYTLFAAFAKNLDDDGSTVLYSVRQWNGGAVNKAFAWRSKVFVLSAFSAPTCARVYADSYPVTVGVYLSSSPDDVFQPSKLKTYTVTGQAPFRLTMRRPEKYLAVEIKGSTRVNHVDIGTSMGGMRNGQ